MAFLDTHVVRIYSVGFWNRVGKREKKQAAITCTQRKNITPSRDVNMPPPSSQIHSLFLSTRPDRVVGAATGCVAFGAGAFFVVAPDTPFLSVFITVRFAGGGAGAAALVAPVAALVPIFLTTVDVLPSLASLMPLALRTARAVDALVVATGAATFLVLVAGARPAAELAVDEVVVLRVAAARVDRAFSTMLLSRFDEEACFMGDAGRAINDFDGDAGARSRGLSRKFDDVGESTFDGSGPASAAAWPRCLFFGLSMLAS